MGWLLRLFAYLAFILVIVGALLGAVFLEPAPKVASAAVPTTADVQTAKKLLRRFREATTAPEEAPAIILSPAEIASLLALGQRAIPGARGEVTLSDGEVAVRGAIPLRLIGAGPWINVSASVPDFDNGIQVAEMQVGRVNLRPDLAVGLAERATSLWLGGDAGADLIAAFPAMRTQPDRLALGIDVEPDGRGEIARTLFSAFRGDGMPTAGEVEEYRQVLLRAFAQGALVPEGSFAPHLAYLLQRAHARGAGGDLAREYTAAVFALTWACGLEHVHPYLGKLLPEGDEIDDAPLHEAPCGEAGFHRRVDLRRHFITAAALRAASNRGVAISIGEFKELNDMGFSSGFDFTDIAANNSGIRMSDRLMSARPDEWPTLLDMLSEERNVIVALDDVPAAMTMDQFEATYRDLQSPQYAAVLDQIEGRIDTLALHATDR